MKERIVFDIANPDDTDNVGSYLRSSDGTLLTHTQVGAKEALDVFVANTVTVTATDLDIRNLVFATDKVDVTGSEVSLDAATLAALETITVEQGTSPWVVSATDLDIRDLSAAQDNVAIRDADGDELEINADGSINANVTDPSNYAEDSAHSSGALGKFMLAVRRDADTSMVDADGDYAPLQVDALGRLKVAADISVSNGFEKLEDSAHASGDVGGYMLSVRQDTLAASTDASGDYQSFKTDGLGRLWTNDTHQTMAHSAISVTNTATDLVAADLANRKKILVQNIGLAPIYLGGASVTASNGLRLSAGGVLEVEIGPGINLHGITQAGSADVRVMELA